MKFQITNKCQEAFCQLKKAFTLELILCHYNSDLLPIVETDVSNFALGAILSQLHEDCLQPVTFHSCKFHSAEVNYEVYDRVILAIVDPLKKWRYYLEGTKHPFIVYTDHENPEYFLTTTSLNRHQARWVELLANYDFTIVYRNRSSNGKADALSRRLEYHP